MFFPKCFSRQNKHFVAPNDISLVEHLSKFEFDSYIDVVISGFEYDMNLLQTHLNHLANLPSLERKLGHTREKLIFRVSSLILPDAYGETVVDVNSEDFLAFLGVSHLKYTSKFTLFIFKILNEGLSTSLSSTFLSDKGFAFINFRKLDNNTLVSNNHDDIGKLSMIIYQSIDWLLPSIQSISNSPRFAQVRLFILCGFPLRRCTPDPLLTNLLEAISQSFNDHTITFQYSVSVLSVSDSISTIFSFAASSGDYWFWKHNMNVESSRAKVVAFLFPNVLNYLLESKEISDILLKDSQGIPHNGVLLPIFSLLLPEEIDAIFPSYHDRVSHSYLFPVVLASTIKSIVMLQPQPNLAYSRGGFKHDVQYMQTSENYQHQILEKFLEKIWHPKITSSHTKLWSESKSSSYITFRNVRTIYRQLIFDSAERVLSRLSAALIYWNKTSDPTRHPSPAFLADLQLIVRTFDVIANDFSHVDYSSVLSELDRLNFKVSEMEGKFVSNLSLPEHGLFMDCKTFEIDPMGSTPTLKLHSLFRFSSIFAGLMIGFVFIAMLFRLVPESRKNTRKVIR